MGDEAVEIKIMSVKWERASGWQGSKAVWTEQHVSEESLLPGTGCVTAESKQGAVGSSVCSSLQSKAGWQEEIPWVFLPK